STRLEGCDRDCLSAILHGLLSGTRRETEPVRVTGRSDMERAPRRARREAATLVLILIVLVAALSVTSSNGAPSVDPPIDAALLTPDAAASGEAPQLLARGDADPT